VHPAAEAVMENATDSVTVPLLANDLRMGLSVWLTRDAGTISGPPAELHWNAAEATCDDRVKLVVAPEHIAGWTAGVMVRSGTGFICVL
jgi:hypothetical protein